MYIEFKRGEKYASKGADISDTPDAFSDCGYLLEEDDLVIDIDETGKDIIKQMISWFDIKTQIVWTDRGAHLYFKKPEGMKKARNGNCALGFKIEMKTLTNTPNGITIKRNGVMRIIENEGVRQELPLIFGLKKRFDNLLGLSEGDERNNKLYAHKIQLANCEGWNKILNFINTFIFAEPLPDKEFEVLTRSENISEKEKDEHYVAELVRNTYKCKVYMGELWFYDGNHYVTSKRKLDQLIYALCDEKNTRFLDEVIRQLDRKSNDEAETDAPFDIKLQNGVLRDGEFIPIDSTQFTPYYIDIPYYPDAKPVKMIDDYIDSLTDGEKEYRDLLGEVLGYTLITDRNVMTALGKFFFFRGDGRNGKGTLLHIIRNILGQDNCTSISIQQLEDSRYNVTLMGKLANLGDDIEAATITDKQMKMLKNLSTADDIATRKMYQEAMNMTSIAKLFFTTNADVSSFEKGYAYQRRVMWLPMFNKVEKPDAMFVTKITKPEALEYWIRLMIEGYMRLYKNGQFTESPKVKEYNEAYHMNNNDMIMFIKDHGKDAFKDKTIKDLKDMYNAWNIDDNRQWNTKRFNNTLSEMYQGEVKPKKVSGRTIRTVVYRDEEEEEKLLPQRDVENNAKSNQEDPQKLQNNFVTDQKSLFS